MTPVLVSALLTLALAPAATLEPAEPALGQRAFLRLEVAPLDSTEWPLGLNAAVRATSDPLVFEFVPLRVGEVGAVLPASGDTLRFAVPATIGEVRPELLRPIHRIGRIGPDWAPTIVVLALALALAGAAAYAFFARRRSRRPVWVPPPEPAEVVALRDLAQLEAARLVEAGRFGEFYVRGSHILREYAGRRFDIPVLDYTTDETLDSMRGDERARPHAPHIASLLQAADAVKFARHEPAAEDGVSWLIGARGFVTTTTPAPEAATIAPDDDTKAGGAMAEVSA